MSGDTIDHFASSIDANDESRSWVSPEGLRFWRSFAEAKAHPDITPYGKIARYIDFKRLCRVEYRF